MDRDLTRHGRTAYRIAQCGCVLIIALRSSLVTSQPAIIGILLLAIFLLGSIVRRIGGNTAGAVGLTLLSFYPQLTDISRTQAIPLLCLVSLAWLLVTRAWTPDKNQIIFAFVLAVLVVFGSFGSAAFLALSPVVAFAYLLQRYVPPDSLRPYRTLWQSLRTDRGRALRGVLIITTLPTLFFVFYRLQPAVPKTIGDPAGYLLGAGHLFMQYVGFRTEFKAVSALVQIGSFVSLWWLFASIQSGNGVAFTLTAIPLAYLVTGALRFVSEPLYALPVHLMLLANLIAFLGLWLRGRTNKLVLDSTRD